MGIEKYEVDLEYLCKTLDFVPEQVVSAGLVYPRGSVPNKKLMWIKVELTNEETKWITRPLADFYEYIRLPKSNLGGRITGEG
jgi:hypothetical protein